MAIERNYKNSSTNSHSNKISIKDSQESSIPIMRAYWYNDSVDDKKQPTGFPGFQDNNPDGLKPQRTLNTENVNNNLEHMDSIVYSSLSIKQDSNPNVDFRSYTYTTNPELVGNVMFTNTLSDFRQPKWGDDYDQQLDWMNDNKDYFPEKTQWGTVFNPKDPNFIYDCTQFGNFEAFSNNNKQKIISVGNYEDLSDHGWKAALEHPDRFSKSIIDIADKFHLNGVELQCDPFSNNNNPEGLIDLAEAVKTEAANRIQDFVISFPVKVDTQLINNFEKYNGNGKTGAWSELIKHVDNIVVNGYSMHDENDKNHKTGLHSNLYTVDPPCDESGLSIDSAVHALIGHGIPANSIILSLPAFAHGVSGVESANLGMSFTDIADPSAPKQHSPQKHTHDGITPYKWLTNDKNIGSGSEIKNVSHEGHDNHITGAFVYLEDSKDFFSFDTPESIEAKVHYAKEMGLGGIAITPIEYDASGSDSLSQAVYDAWYL